MENIHDGDTFLFSCIAFEKQSANMEPFHKFCGKNWNIISILCCLFYTWHGMNLLVVYLFLAIQLYYMQVIYAIFYRLKY